jgi:hypothetical protein
MHLKWTALSVTMFKVDLMVGVWFGHPADDHRRLAPHLFGCAEPLSPITLGQLLDLELIEEV